MTEFFDDQRRRILVDDLVYRHHGAHVEQHLDDLITLDGEPFREICHRNALWNLNLVDYRGSRQLRSGDTGGNYFVRQHPLFAGLPVNTAYNWEYQCLAQYQDRERFGLRLLGEQCVVGCFADHQQELMTAVGVVPLGRGRILLSTLDLEAAIMSESRASIVAKQILLNYLTFATRRD